MFTKILIANRGEIAVRVARAAKALGVTTVAVYSEADRNSFHVRAADEAVSLGSGPASENYLNQQALIAAAISSGAAAIHPGYGFLSENAAFADAVAMAGLKFIGPRGDAIRAMGEKVAARNVAQAAQVPLVPGSEGPVTDPEQVLAFGETHGYPVLIKASHGGGGRGMRKVTDSAEVPEAYAGAVREATAAFGNGEVYLERYLTKARHVEVQVFADQHGNTVWLGDRDCSVQRRHQKLVEEAPAPNLPDQLRRDMGDAAVRLAQKVKYEGAGTVEFLVEDGAFYFLEMNTRIQVEHPVTEAVIGLDLVMEQIKVAAGQPLSITESGPPVRGAAIEVRLNAEDVAGGLFLPSPGNIEVLLAPLGEGIRFDAGYESGDEVLPFYDSLIGKLIAWGPDRDTAIQRLTSAVRDLRVVGVKTTASAALAVLEHSDFQQALMTTHWLESTVSFPESAEEEELLRDEVIVNGRYYRIPSFPETQGAARGNYEQALAQSDSAANSGSQRSRSVASKSRSRGGVNDSKVRASMQGTIVTVNVKAGDSVKAGETLFVLEAMKMENPIKAHRDGVIVSVEALVGEIYPAGTVLAEFEGI